MSIAIAGGTFGLFAGFSLVTSFEIIFWAIKICFNKFDETDDIAKESRSFCFNMLNLYCQQASLHGWEYLSQVVQNKKCYNIELEHNFVATADTPRFDQVALGRPLARLLHLRVECNFAGHFLPLWRAAAVNDNQQSSFERVAVPHTNSMHGSTV